MSRSSSSSGNLGKSTGKTAQNLRQLIPAAEAIGARACLHLGRGHAPGGAPEPLRRHHRERFQRRRLRQHLLAPWPPPSPTPASTPTPSPAPSPTPPLPPSPPLERLSDCPLAFDLRTAVLCVSALISLAAAVYAGSADAIANALADATAATIVSAFAGTDFRLRRHHRRQLRVHQRQLRQRRRPRRRFAGTSADAVTHTVAETSSTRTADLVDGAALLWPARPLRPAVCETTAHFKFPGMFHSDVRDAYSRRPGHVEGKLPKAPSGRLSAPAAVSHVGLSVSTSVDPSADTNAGINGDLSVDVLIPAAEEIGAQACFASGAGAPGGARQRRH